MATRLERSIDWGTKLSGGNEVTYRFVPKGEKSPSPDGRVVSAGFNAYEKAQFKEAFKLVASYTDLRFRKVGEASAADLSFTSVEDDEDWLGAMGPPGYGLSAGYGAFNHLGVGWDNLEPGTGGLEQGGYGFVTIIHELGHGLGLAHPHDNGGGSSIFPGVGGSDDRGRFDLNQGIYTMMTYNDGWETNPHGEPPGFGYGYQGTPMAIDIAVLQAKYGVDDTYRKGANTYRLPDANETGTFYACIWDAGGNDRIVCDSGAAATIDLRAATLRPEPGGGGYLSYVDGIFGGFTIANTVKIENARGGSGDDVLVGNAAPNRMTGGDGNDTIDGRGSADRLFGGAGDDVLVGGRGADELNGGPGITTMTGGPGHDRFVFDVSPADGAIATITDFAPGRDAFVLTAEAFAGVGSKGGVDPAAFGLGDVATSAVHHILHDPATGAVRYDADGAGGVAAIEFARVAPGLALSHADFIVAA